MTLLCNHRRLWRSLLVSAVAASFLGGCSSPDDDDNDPGTLTGVITGTVLDSNGTPIAGAVIRYGGASANGEPLEATTNVNGQFQMPEVVVTGFDTGGANDENGPITLVLQATGYMGATVLVNPRAQSTGSVGGGTIFVDNFNVDTGPVKLPALNTTVSGVLRDQSTGTPVGQARVTLDFRGVEFDQDGTEGIAATYDSVANRVATTDDGGTFSFTGVYADSCLGLVVTDYSVEGVTGAAPPCTAPGSDPNALYFATSDDGGTLNLANVTVASFRSGDTVAPVVSAVQGVVDATQNPAQLESSVDDSFVVVFSEALHEDLLDSTDVTVVLGGQTAAEVAAAAVDGNTVTVTLSEDLPNNTAVDLHIAREALKDLAGNGVALNGAIAYDSLSSSDLILSFTSFSPSSTVADAAEVEQVSAQVDIDDLAYETTDALLDTVAAGSEDIRPALTSAGATTAYPAGATAVEHLNAPAAFEELDRLYDFVDPVDGPTGTVTTGLARVRVQKPANANDFVVWLERDGAKLDVSFYPVATGSGNPQNTAVIISDGSPTYVITPNGATGFDLLIRSPTPAVFVVEPGDVFHIVSRNTAGLLGKEATLSLRDNGRPSVALQTLGLLLAGTQGGSEVGGSGTVILPATNTAPAKLLLPVTPQAADINDTENGTNQATGFGADDWKGASELQGLSDDLLAGSEFAEGLVTTEAIGDADGTAAFLAQPTTLGITLTEPAVDLNVPPATSGLQSATVSADPANSDVFNGLPNEDGSLADVFFVKLNSPFALASDALADIVDISLQGSIADLNGVRPDAATRALVQVTDRMPPLVTLAFYDGVNFVFRFNEAVRATGAIALEQCAASIDLASTEDSNADTIPDVQQIDSATFKVQSHVVDDVVGDLATCFGLPSYAEASYSAEALNDPALTSVNPAAEPPHGAISYQTVQDLAGGDDTDADNSWDRWAAEALGITKPFFAMANITPAP